MRFPSRKKKERTNHIPRQNQLLSPILLQIFMEIRAGERRRVMFLHYLSPPISSSALTPPYKQKAPFPSLLSPPTIFPSPPPPTSASPPPPLPSPPLIKKHTFSPLPAFTASISSPCAASKTGAPFGVRCKTWTTSPPLSRYLPSRVAMAEEVESTSTVRSLPVAYSFCASMMISVLSVGVAVEGGVPIRARKDFGGSDGMFW